MEEYMEPENSGILLVKLLAQNIALMSPGAHFIHMVF